MYISKQLKNVEFLPLKNTQKRVYILFLNKTLWMTPIGYFSLPTSLPLLWSLVAIIQPLFICSLTSGRMVVNLNSVSTLYLSFFSEAY